MNKIRNLSILVLIMIFSLFMAACVGGTTESTGGNNPGHSTESVVNGGGTESVIDAEQSESKDEGQSGGAVQESNSQESVNTPAESRPESVVIPEESESESVIIPEESESESVVIPEESESESVIIPEESESESVIIPEESESESVITPEESESESVITPEESESESVIIPEESESESESITIKPIEPDVEKTFLTITLVICDENGVEIKTEKYELEDCDSISLRDFVNNHTDLGSLYDCQQLGYFTVYGFPSDGSTLLYDGNTVRYTYYHTDTEISVTFNGNNYTVESGCTLGEFAENAGLSISEGTWTVNDETEQENYVLQDGDIVSYEPYGDGGGYNVSYVDKKNGIEDTVFVAPNTTLEQFINDLIWLHLYEYTFANFYGFIECGTFTVNGETGIRNGEYVLYSEYVVEFVWTEIECDHYYNETGFCYYCGLECEHVLDGEGVCSVCGKGRDYSVDCVICICYYSYEEGTPYVDYVPSYRHINCSFNTEYGEEPSLFNIVEKNLGFDMVNDNSSFYNLVWSRNGEHVSSDVLIMDGDYIVATPSEFEIKPFTVTVSVDGKNEKSYYYDYPVAYEMITKDYLKTVRIDESNYRMKITYGGKSFDDGYTYGSAISVDAEITFIENSSSVSVKFTDENGESATETYTYPSTQKPTLGEFLSSINVSVDEYYVLSGGKPVTDFESRDYYDLNLVKRSIVCQSFTVEVYYCREESEYGFSWSATATLSEPITLYRLLYDGFENGYNHVMNGYEFIYKINGEILNDDLKSVDAYNYLIIEDCCIEIVPAFRYYVGIDGESGSEVEIISEQKLTGAQILEKAEIEIDLDNYRIRQDGWTYIERDMFLNETYPYSGTNSASFLFVPGMVRVEIVIEDEMGGIMQPEYVENGISVNIKNCNIGGNFEDYVWTVKNPDGATFEITDQNYEFMFNSAYVEEYGMSFFTVYTLYGVAKTFTVTLYIDGQYVGEKVFEKDKNYTFRQIVEEYGYSYSAYDWSFYGEWYGENDIVNKRIEIYGTDNRPTVTLYVNGQNYVIYHTETLTLSQLLSLVHEQYGVKINYDDYIWSYGEDDVVAEVGYSQTVSGKKLTQVTVYFCMFYGPVDGAVNWESGESNYKFTADSLWDYPDSFAIDFAYGLLTFNGNWEYRTESEYGETESIPVNSVDELFALKKEEVYLNAVFEPNYANLCGTYVLLEGYSRIFTITEENVTYIEADGKNERTVCGYSLTTEGGMLKLSLENGMEIEGMYLQEYYKMNDGKFYAFIAFPWGIVEYCDSFDSYLTYAENYDIVTITDLDGAFCESVEMGGIYFVSVEEKIYEETV